MKQINCNETYIVTANIQLNRVFNRVSLTCASISPVYILYNRWTEGNRYQK